MEFLGGLQARPGKKRKRVTEEDENMYPGLASDTRALPR
jgi:hypothetical protein